MLLRGDVVVGGRAMMCRLVAALFLVAMARSLSIIDLERGTKSAFAKSSGKRSGSEMLTFDGESERKKKYNSASWSWKDGVGGHFWYVAARQAGSAVTHQAGSADTDLTGYAIADQSGLQVTHQAGSAIVHRSGLGALLADHVITLTQAPPQADTSTRPRIQPRPVSGSGTPSPPVKGLLSAPRAIYVLGGEKKAKALDETRRSTKTSFLRIPKPSKVEGNQPLDTSNFYRPNPPADRTIPDYDERSFFDYTFDDYEALLEELRIEEKTHKTKSKNEGSQNEISRNEGLQDEISRNEGSQDEAPQNEGPQEGSQNKRAQYERLHENSPNEKAIDDPTKEPSKSRDTTSSRHLSSKSLKIKEINSMEMFLIDNHSKQDEVVSSGQSAERAANPFATGGGEGGGLSAEESAEEERSGEEEEDASDEQQDRRTVVHSNRNGRVGRATRQTSAKVVNADGVLV